MGGSQYEWPDDGILKAAVEKESVKWLADELGVPEQTLRSHLRKRGLPTSSPKKLEISDALRKVADLVSD